MQHRYGRHGPDAWLRQRNRRRNSSSLELIRSDFGAILQAWLQWEQRERIIIVEVAASDENTQPTPRTFQLPPDPFRDWKESARIAAYTRLHEDLEQYGEPSADQQLSNIAQNSGRKELKNFPGITERGKTMPELIDMYETTFIHAFRELILEEKNRGRIKDEKTLAVERRARQDRSLKLSEEQLPIYGTIHAMRELLKIDVPPGSFSRLEELARAYAHAYKDQKEVMQDYPASFYRG